VAAAIEAAIRANAGLIAAKITNASAEDADD
jgi:recombination protein RecA